MAVRPPLYSNVAYTWSGTSRPSLAKRYTPPDEYTASGTPSKNQLVMAIWWLPSSASRPRRVLAVQAPVQQVIPVLVAPLLGIEVLARAALPCGARTRSGATRCGCGTRRPACPSSGSRRRPRGRSGCRSAGSRSPAAACCGRRRRSCGGSWGRPRPSSSRTARACRRPGAAPPGRRGSTAAWRSGPPPGPPSPASASDPGSRVGRRSPLAARPSAAPFEWAGLMSQRARMSIHCFWHWFSSTLPSLPEPIRAAFTGPPFFGPFMLAAAPSAASGRDTGRGFQEVATTDLLLFRGEVHDPLPSSMARGGRAEAAGFRARRSAQSRSSPAIRPVSNANSASTANPSIRVLFTSR